MLPAIETRCAKTSGCHSASSVDAASGPTGASHRSRHRRVEAPFDPGKADHGSGSRRPAFRGSFNRRIHGGCQLARCIGSKPAHLCRHASTCLQGAEFRGPAALPSPAAARASSSSSDAAAKRGEVPAFGIRLAHDDRPGCSPSASGSGFAGLNKPFSGRLRQVARRSPTLAWLPRQ
jgi:hypothetical protein